MHAVLQRFRIRLGTAEAAARQAEEGLLPLLRRVPGFVAYYLLDAGDSIVASVGLFETEVGAEAATRICAKWFRSDRPAFTAVPPERTTGAVLVQAAASRDAGARVSREGVRIVERRTGQDRRWGGERRVVTPAERLPAASFGSP